MSGRENSVAGIDPDIGRDLPSEIPSGSGPHYEVARALAALMTVACIGWNLDLPALLGFALIEESFQASVLGLGLAIVFLTFTVARRETKQLAWYDGLLAIAALGLLFYVGANFLRLKQTGY